MAIGFIGLGHMGFPMARRLLDEGFEIWVSDIRDAVLEEASKLGAQIASSPKDVADHAETVMASLPSLAASLDVVNGSNGVIEGTRIARFIDFSTVGAAVAQANHQALAAKGIAALDCPVSGGVAGATDGTLAIMVSGPQQEFEQVADLLEVLGHPILVGEKPGAAQTMKLINNLMAAATLAATAEVVVMGVKAGLDPHKIIDVLNAGSGATHASRDKFPKSVLPRTFDFGFATGLMVKDVRLYLDETKELELSAPIAECVAALWETTLRDEGSESDFTAIVKPVESSAGVIVDGRRYN